MAHPLPGGCPVCGGEMYITRTYCPDCDVTLEGRFSPGRLHHLAPEQLHFVETFIRCEGTIKRVERELGISYPTVRSRLQEVIRAMGFAVVSDYAEEAELTEAARREVLDQLDRGEITSEQALEMLRS